MKAILSEKNLVVILFILVLITFSLAQEDTRKMEKIYSGATLAGESSFLTSLESELQNHSAPAEEAE
jgi:hypothetical protein